MNILGRSRRRWAIALGLLLACTFQAGAQSSGGIYSVDRAVIANGGGTIHGGNYDVSTTLGQPAAGVLAASGYRLYGGFWAAAANTDSSSSFILNVRRRPSWMTVTVVV